MSKYNAFGIDITIPKPDIFKDDTVQYIDTRKDSNGKSCKYTLIGIWDGKKVEFHDKNDTILRTTWWLSKVEFPKERLKFLKQ